MGLHGETIFWALCVANGSETANANGLRILNASMREGCFGLAVVISCARMDSERVELPRGMSPAEADVVIERLRVAGLISEAEADANRRCKATDTPAYEDPRASPVGGVVVEHVVAGVERMTAASTAFAHSDTADKSATRSFFKPDGRTAIDLRDARLRWHGDHDKPKLAVVRTPTELAPASVDALFAALINASFGGGVLHVDGHMPLRCRLVGLIQGKDADGRFVDLTFEAMDETTSAKQAAADVLFKKIMSLAPLAVGDPDAHVDGTEIRDLGVLSRSFKDVCKGLAQKPSMALLESFAEPLRLPEERADASPTINQLCHLTTDGLVTFCATRGIDAICSDDDLERVARQRGMVVQRLDDEGADSAAIERLRRKGFSISGAHCGYAPYPATEGVFEQPTVIARGTAVTSDGERVDIHARTPASEPVPSSPSTTPGGSL